MPVIPLMRVDAYLDAVPRTAADAIDAGPFTVFRSTTVSTYYARPRVGLTNALTPADLLAVRETCSELGVPFAIEAVLELTPSLVDAARAAALTVEVRPLLALRREDRVEARRSSEAVVRTLSSADPGQVVARAVADVSFAAGGVGIGPEGGRERDEAAGRIPPERASLDAARNAAGLTIVAAAHLDGHGVVGVGWHQPIRDCTEVVGVATLPAFRRRGIAADIVRCLLDDAFARGVEVALLSATDDDVARVYERVGFLRVGHAVEVSAGSAPPA